MKVIDLLNKIANEDEIPEKIKYENYIYWYDKDWKDYKNAQVEFRSYLISCRYHTTDFLNKEVEIIEDTLKHFDKEENQAVKNIIKKISVPVKENYNDYYEDTSKEDKKIEKIDISKFPKRNNSLKKTALKVNEIIDKINGE